MTIDGKIAEGYVLLCDRCDESFLTRRIGPSIECPHCGNTEMPGDMMTDFLVRRAAASAVA